MVPALQRDKQTESTGGLLGETQFLWEYKGTILLRQQGKPAPRASVEGPD